MYDITGSFLLWESVPMVAGSLGEEGSSVLQGN